jgi:hypothetical protein
MKAFDNQLQVSFGFGLSAFAQGPWQYPQPSLTLIVDQESINWSAGLFMAYKLQLRFLGLYVDWFTHTVKHIKNQMKVFSSYLV